MADSFSTSPGVTLGGSSVAVDADAMRAARLSRLAAPSLEVNPRSTAEPQRQAPSTCTSTCIGNAAELVATSNLGEFETSQQSTVGLASSFACMPEGALLRIAAMVDLQSGLALATACSAAGETTTPALTALRQAIIRAKHLHEQETQAIEQVRAQSNQQMNAEQQAHAAALAALEPLRSDRHQERYPQLAQIFGMLEEAAGPSPGVTAELEEALAARMAAALEALHANESIARAHIADGELQVALLQGHIASAGAAA